MRVCACVYLKNVTTTSFSLSEHRSWGLAREEKAQNCFNVDAEAADAGDNKLDGNNFEECVLV